MSQGIIKGRIAETSSKPWKDSRTGQDIVLYSFKLEGQRTWYRTGTTPTPFGVGQTVQFVADGQKVDTNSFQAIAQDSVQAPAPSAAQSSSGSTQSSSSPGRGNASSRDEYWANKEARDLEKDKRYQEVDIPRMTMCTAISSAAAVVDAAFKSEALSFGNAAKSKRLDMIGDFVEQLADRLYLKIVSTATNPPVDAATAEAAMDAAYAEDEGE